MEEALNSAFTDLRTAGVSTAAACVLTGRSRATHYRHADPAGVRLGPVHGPHRARRLPPATITDDERAAVLAVLNSETYRDLAIPQVWARELDEGRFYVFGRAEDLGYAETHLAGVRGGYLGSSTFRQVAGPGSRSREAAG